MQVSKEELRIRGRTHMVDSIRIDDNIVIVTGNFVKTARIKDEWFVFEDLHDPDSLVEKLKKAKLNVDIFTFVQRLPETQPKYDYHLEWESVAGMFVKSYDDWWDKQIDKDVRKKIRKAEKKGVVVRVVDFNDELVKGITSIYNESPIRQGKPSWNYGKDFDTVKKEASTYLDKCDFIGAYYNDELIGFIKLVYTEKFACTMHVISKIKYHDKAPTNALLAKIVELCCRKGFDCLTYGEWSDGTLGDFKRHNGFRKIDLPRYYYPLTSKGKIALRLNFHHSVLEVMPEKLKVRLKALRKRWYGRKYGEKSKIEEENDQLATVK